MGQPAPPAGTQPPVRQQASRDLPPPAGVPRREGPWSQGPAPTTGRRSPGTRGAGAARPLGSHKARLPAFRGRMRCPVPRHVVGSGCPDHAWCPLSTLTPGKLGSPGEAAQQSVWIQSGGNEHPSPAPSILERVSRWVCGPGARGRGVGSEEARRLHPPAYSAPGRGSTVLVGRARGAGAFCSASRAPFPPGPSTQRPVLPLSPPSVGTACWPGTTEGPRSP